MHTYIPTYLHLYTYKYTSALDMVEQMKVSSDAEYMEGVAATKAEAAELKLKEEEENKVLEAAMDAAKEAGEVMSMNYMNMYLYILHTHYYYSDLHGRTDIPI